MTSNPLNIYYVLTTSIIYMQVYSENDSYCIHFIDFVQWLETLPDAYPK